MKQCDENTPAYNLKISPRLSSNRIASPLYANNNNNNNTINNS